MQEYIVELSKYLIAICMAFYAFTCFYAFRYREEEKRKGIYIVQNILMFSVQVLSFLDLSIVSRNIQYLFVNFNVVN